MDFATFLIVIFVTALFGIGQAVVAALNAIELEVDGGINRETAPQAIAAGANVLVAGTATFTGGPAAYAENIAALRRQ